MPVFYNASENGIAFKKHAATLAALHKDQPCSAGGTVTISAEEFKQGMRRLGGAVNIVTSGHDNMCAGLTATSVTSLSAEPPRLLVCVNRQGATYETISKSQVFAINVLGVEHKALAMQFAGMTDIPETDRFADTVWNFGKTGAPLLGSALASFDCEVEGIMDVGSHGIVVGNVRAVITSQEDEISPLFYVDGSWAELDALS